MIPPDFEAKFSPISPLWVPLGQWPGNPQIDQKMPAKFTCFSRIFFLLRLDCEPNENHHWPCFKFSPPKTGGSLWRVTRTALF
jgi:hypothetical protein